MRAEQMKKLIMTILFSSLLFGCSNTPPSPALSKIWSEHQSEIAQLQSWSFSGKLALISKTERHSVNVFWKQKDDQFQITLTSFLGSTVLNIKKTKEITRITTREGKVYYGEDTEKLVKELSGLVIPIELLQEWIKGNPLNADFQLNEQDLVSSLSGNDQYNNNWLANYSEYKTVNGINLPVKLQLKNESFRLKFSISHWRY